jgi:hypothetical protein
MSQACGIFNVSHAAFELRKTTQKLVFFPLSALLKPFPTSKSFYSKFKVQCDVLLSLPFNRQTTIANGTAHTCTNIRQSANITHTTALSQAKNNSADSTLTTGNSRSLATSSSVISQLSR